MFFKLCHGHIQIDILSHREGWNQVECNLRYNAKQAKAYNSAIKSFGVFFARKRNDVAFCIDKFDSGYRRSQISVLNSRAVRCSSARSGNGNMRE
jgi:hypothetical protein